jgi:signal transduction histidine kinase
MAALANIIENSIEAIEKKGTIAIKTSLVEEPLPAGAGRRAGRLIRVKIEDSGAGIPADQLKHIFEPFYSSKVGGTGLGLVIAKKIVDDHYGKIRVDSQVGVGTAVTIELPI